MRVYKIYDLACPITNQLRYVGQTVRPIKIRLDAHINEKGNNKKHQWIKSLKKKKKKPEIFVIDRTRTKKSCNSLEIFYIGYFKMIGSRLNVSVMIFEKESVADGTTEHIIAASGFSSLDRSSKSGASQSDADAGIEVSFCLRRIVFS